MAARKLLILEDDKWFAEILTEVLRADFTIKILDNPEGFFEIYEKWQPDVMLADVVLGAKNLFALLNEMQSYDDTRKVPIIILSSSAQRIDSNDVVDYNIKKILDKAEMTPSDLREDIQEICEELYSKKAEK